MLGIYKIHPKGDSFHRCSRGFLWQRVSGASILVIKSRDYISRIARTLQGIWSRQLYIFFFIASLTRRKANFIIHRSRWAHFRSLDTTTSAIRSLSQGFCELLPENEWIYISHKCHTHIWKRVYSCGQSRWQIVAHIWTSKPVYSHLYPSSFMAMKSVSFAFQASEGEGCHCLRLQNITVKHMREQVFWSPNQKQQGEESMRERKTPPAKAWHVWSPEIQCYGLHAMEHPVTQDWVLRHSGAYTASPSNHTD